MHRRERGRSGEICAELYDLDEPLERPRPEVGGLFMLELESCGELASRGSLARRWQTAAGDALTLALAPVELDFVNQRFVQHVHYERWRAGLLLVTELDIVA